ncbi:leucine-rich repeat neuronal protein 4 [Hippocampus zosterae]|uniref:leucine-rich repeat neuronal protein 4 n=1 Tax=Hippocampus zosterae TaxID=109293 RepID=UPI00223E512E|nr:leucine-rich repeat neuronal protein 4 [Hippocampus zosterae]XP_051903420.1 leucine-rich repeat neuronal protein 4 [Hippocampus zosterae]
MAAGRRVPLMVICLLLFSGSTSQPTTKQETGADRTRPEALALPSDDYHDNEDEVETVPTKTVPSNGGTSKRCEYNPCEEDQPTCFELSVINACLCPGSTSHLVAPEAPFLKTLTWNGSDVVLRWCAPHSFVKGYRVTVGGSERRRFGKERRGGGVGPVENVSEVCVLALNDAGESEGSCMMYRPDERSVALKAGLIGGTLGLLLLVSLAVLLWRRRQQRKRQNGIPTGGAA